jgi:RNA polymerase sigma factor (TIGR02999 family)
MDDTAQTGTVKNQAALRPLMPLMYDELRRLARHYLHSERPDHTLQGTALVHEVYIRLAHGRTVALPERGSFIAAASRLMRQTLVDYARERRARKRDWGTRVTTGHVAAPSCKKDGDLLALNDALEKLSHIDERQGNIVEMKFFGGFSAPEISRVLGISRATVDREWSTARIWLRRQMSRA